MRIFKTFPVYSDYEGLEGGKVTLDLSQVSAVTEEGGRKDLRTRCVVYLHAQRHPFYLAMSRADFMKVLNKYGLNKSGLNHLLGGPTHL